jgi:SAM-dependent methyltransferase
MFKEYASEMSCTPWLDVGAGASYMRDLLPLYVTHDDKTDLDNYQYTYSRGKFGLITSFEVIEHLFNPLFHLEELHRVLHRGGNLIIATPNDYSLIYKAEHLLSRKYRPHFHQFSERDMRDILKLAGFRVVTLRKYFGSRSGTLARISRNGLFIHCVKDNEQQAS